VGLRLESALCSDALLGLWLDVNHSVCIGIRIAVGIMVKSWG